MFNVYVLYLSLNNGDVNFSKTYSSFNKAKDKIDDFINNFFTKRGKKLVYVDKDQLENIKKTVKKDDQNLYIKRKKSEATIYGLNVSVGTVYNSYSLEKKGQLGIRELSVKVPSFYLNEEEIEESDSDDFDLVHVSKVGNYEHGAHVNFISELKSVLSNRVHEKIEIPKSYIDNSKMDNFISDLVNGKKGLSHVSPPTPKLYVEDVIDDGTNDFKDTSLENCN